MIESRKHQGETMFTVEAVIDEKGNVKILQPIPLQGARRALVVVLDEPARNVAETALLSEATLAEDWMRTEEDEAWSYLKRATS
jgi:hypothetical protein